MITRSTGYRTRLISIAYKPRVLDLMQILLKYAQKKSKDHMAYKEERHFTMNNWVDFLAM